MRRLLRSLSRASAVATGVLALAATARAETSTTTSDATGDVAASDAGGQLAEIVVTAQKRSQSVQAVPAAIDAISGANLDQRGITDVNDLQFAVPSFHSGTLMGSTGITIRGVGATNVGTGGTSGVAVNVDGVYQAQTSTADLAQMDLQRVEVLRGPQGTLYGHNATGGAVNFLSNAPTNQFEGSLLAGYATYDEYHLQGMINEPLSDSVRTRLVVDYRDREDGFVKSIEPGGEDLDKGKTLSGRFRLSADLTSNLDFDLGVSALHSTGPWQYLSNYSGPTAAALQLNPVLANAKFIYTPWRTDDNDPVDGSRNYQSVSGTFTWNLPFAQLKSISAFQNYDYTYQNDADGTNLSILPYSGKTTDKTLTQEFDLVGTWDRLDWVGGLFYLHENNVNIQQWYGPLGINGLPPGVYFDFAGLSYHTNSYAAFVDGTFRLTDALKLIGGARYSEDHQVATYGTPYGFVVDGQNVPAGFFCPYETDRLKSDAFTPRAGLQYDISSPMNVYFTYSQGYKAGGANVYSCENDYAPEKITSYEVGFKSRWLDNAVTFNVSAFHYDYTNFQVSQVVGLSLELTNAAGAKVDGVEFESAWTPDNHWSLNANFSYINAVYSNFFNSDGLSPQLGLQNLKGNLLDNSPRDSGAVGVAYRTDPSSFGRLTARVDTSYRSRTFFREFNEALDSQASYGLVNLNLIWDSPDRRYTARIYANNLTDRAYIEAMNDSPNLGTRYVTWGAPRQVGGEIKLVF